MKLRNSNLKKLEAQTFDVLVLGGGINGAVSAAALAGKGVKTALIDRGDFAGFTSSHSSNLVWGGIKYLESHEYFLVQALCKGRNHLMKHYPSTVKEIRFLTSIQTGFRFPVWMVYLGTLVYWGLGRFFTHPPKFLTTSRIKEIEPLIHTSNLAGGFEYSDSYLHDNDARFVFNFIRSSLDYGGIIANYVESLGAHRENNLWITQARDLLTGHEFLIRSKALVNATGPFVDTHNSLTKEQTKHHHLFSKGVHLIVDQVTPQQKVLTFFASDGRLFFMVPMGNRTCIGTTDTHVENPYTQVTVEDRKFILDNVNQLLNLPKKLTEDDIIAERCGVRPLAQQGKGGAADWVKLSRKHAIDINTKTQHLSIFGGKLTDCLNVGDEVAEIIQGFGISIPYANYCWYGEPAGSIKDEFFHQAKLLGLDQMTQLASGEVISQRLWRRYGTRALSMLEHIRENPAEAEILIKATEYLRCEIKEAATSEMITKLDDFLRRRSKIALILQRNEILTSPGLQEACEILFGEEAKTKLQEYIQLTEKPPTSN